MADGPTVVWLASFPRAGVTFVRHVIEAIYGLPTYSVYPGEARTTGMYKGDQRWPHDADPSLPVHFVKVHEAEFAARNTPAIHIVRDGRDSLISYAHFQRDICENPYDYQSILTALLNGNEAYRHWGLHTLAWSTRDVPRIEFARLIADPIKEVTLAVDALGLGLTATDIPVIEVFESLKAKRPKFFRSGQTGQWRNEFTPAQLSAFEAVHGAAQQWYERTYPNGKCENGHVSGN